MLYFRMLLLMIIGLFTSDILVKNYAENLGYEYLSAKDKESFLSVIERFLIPTITEKPMILEVFTDTQEESDALVRILNFATGSFNIVSRAKSAVQTIIRDAIGDNRIKVAKDFIRG